MTFHDYKVNKQAIKDLAEGKKTDVVKEFLKRYEIRPRENRVRYNKHPSNNSNRRHSRCHKSRKARAIVTMRT